MTAPWGFRLLFLVTGVVCVAVLGGGAWFLGGFCLGWLWAVLEFAAMSREGG